MDLKAKIREILDFPTPGVKFKDITPLLEDKNTFRQAVDGLAIFLKDTKVDKVVGIDARGFLLASAIAYLIGAGMVMVRKKNKLPRDKIVQEHNLEYGTGLLEIHTDSIKPGERIAIIDDVLATGGTAEATVKLVEKLAGNIVAIVFLVELSYLGGRNKLAPYPVYSLIEYQ